MRNVRLALIHLESIKRSVELLQSAFNGKDEYDDPYGPWRESDTQDTLRGIIATVQSLEAALK